MSNYCFVTDNEKYLLPRCGLVPVYYLKHRWWNGSPTLEIPLLDNAVLNGRQLTQLTVSGPALHLVPGDQIS